MSRDIALIEEDTVRLIDLYELVLHPPSAEALRAAGLYCAETATAPIPPEQREEHDWRQECLTRIASIIEQQRCGKYEAARKDIDALTALLNPASS